MPNTFLIAGGGIAGLATAIALARRGLRCRVLERDGTPAETGAGIQIGPNGTRVLDLLGVSPLLAPHVGKPESIIVRDASSGRELTRMPLGGWLADRHGAAYRVAHRADLHRALRARAEDEPLIELSFGAEVASVAAGDDTVIVTTTTGETASGAALIGADGIRSAVRKEVTPASITFAGRTAMRTVLPLDAAGAQFRQAFTGLWLSPDAHVVHYPVRGGAEIAIVVILKEDWQGEGWSAPVPTAEAALRVARFAPELRDFLSCAQEWRRWALFDARPFASWFRGRVVLTGDAAHPMLPFMAQGAVMALEDAVTLADAIASQNEDLPSAFRVYESRRRARVSRVQAASRQNGVIYHLSGLPALARNAALKLVPSERLMARYDWLYGWRADEADSAAAIRAEGSQDR